MASQRINPEVFADVWERYQLHCKEKGFIPLCQFCKPMGIKPEPLYEWLRRRHISLSGYQRQYGVKVLTKEQSSSTKEGFCAVEVSSHSDKAQSNGVNAAAMHGIRIELRSGDSIVVEGMSISEIGALAGIINSSKDVER